jgi:hypothetical protein
MGLVACQLAINRLNTMGRVSEPVIKIKLWVAVCAIDSLQMGGWSCSIPGVRPVRGVAPAAGSPGREHS